MRIKAIFFFAGISALFSPVCMAQNSIAASLYGAFNQSTSGNGVQQSPSNSAGVLLELRHISNPLIGWEATYAYNRANQKYSSASGTPPCPTSGCTVPLAANVSNNAHQITGDWIVSLKFANLKPFALAGGGLLLNVPNSGTVTTQQCSGSTCQTSATVASTNTSTKGVFVYGAGVDWTVLPHLGLRFQYRGNLYKAAALTNAFSSTNAFTRTSQPMIGAFLRF